VAELYLWSIPTLQYHSSSSAYAMRSAMKPNMLSVRMWQLGGELNASQIISSLVKHKLTVSVPTARRTPVVIMDKKNVGMTDRVNKFWAVVYEHETTCVLWQRVPSARLIDSLIDSFISRWSLCSSSSAG